MRRPLEKFFRDRGPHLAAMIAYFALLSFVPLTFLALSLRSWGVILAARLRPPFLPPRFPRATAAGFLRFAMP